MSTRPFAPCLTRWRREGWHRLGHAAYHLGICAGFPLRNHLLDESNGSLQLLIAHRFHTAALETCCRVNSPIKFDGKLAKELLGLGAVRHLVSPNQFHYAHIGDWAKAFPNTVSWASPRVRERARARHVDVDFTRDLETSPPEEWRREIDQTLFPGGYFKEFIFFHKASKTLILADTMINIELNKVTEPWRTATKFTGMYHPYGQIFFGMRLPLFLQRQKAEAAIRKIYSWQPQRILLSHGRCFDSDADKVIRRIFGEPPC
jgi:hypothetical protein